jgi:DNA-binding SARP family transcriptional activator
MFDRATGEASAGDPVAPTYRLELLGGFAFRTIDGPVTIPSSARRVLAFLALRDRPVARGQVAGNLWLDKDEARAQGNLRSALWRLPGGKDEVVVAKGADLVLSAAVAVDTREVGELARSQSPATACEVIVPSGTLLPDWTDEWLVLERERLRQLQMGALEQLSDRLAQAGAVARAIDVAWSAVTMEPLRESAHRCLVRAHLAAGNGAEAVRQYRLYRDLLESELGIACSPAMEALIAPLAMTGPADGAAPSGHVGGRRLTQMKLGRIE